MDKSPTVELADIWAPLRKGWPVIAAVAAVSLAVSLAITLLSPRIYLSEAIGAVPESSKLTAISSESHGTMFVMVNVGGTTPYKSRPTTVTLVNVAETRAMVAQLRQRLDNGEPPPPFKADDCRTIMSIRLDPIRGSENHFRLTALTLKDQETAREAVSKVLEYLSANQYVQEKITGEVTAAEQNIQDTEEALARAIKHRDALSRSGQFRQNPNFNPAELEASINGLGLRLAALKNHRSGISSYRYIEPPSGRHRPVKPDLVANLLMSLALGLFLGLLIVFAKRGLAGR